MKKLIYAEMDPKELFFLYVIWDVMNFTTFFSIKMSYFRY